MNVSKNRKLAIMIAIISIFVAATIIFISVYSGSKDYLGNANGSNPDATQPDYRTEVEEAYKYNTEIISNTNPPVEGEPDVQKLTGYVEDTEQTFIDLPYMIKSEIDGTEQDVLKIVSIGKYTGAYIESPEGVEVKDAFAIVVENVTDKYISIANISFNYDDSKTCTFSPSNIPPHQSVVMLTGAEAVMYSDIKSLKNTDNFILTSNDAPPMSSDIGVDYKDGSFVVTNLTSNVYSSVYVKYKNCVPGNSYLGGNTYSVLHENVLPYETYFISAANFDPATSIIIAVETFK